MTKYKQALKKYNVEDIRDLFAIPLLKYQNCNYDTLLYSLCLMVLYISLDDKYVNDFSEFSKEFENEMFKCCKEIKNDEDCNQSFNKILEKENMKIH